MSLISHLALQTRRIQPHPHVYKSITPAGVLLRLGTPGFTQAHQRVSPFGNLPRASPLTLFLVCLRAWVLPPLASSPFGRFARLRGYCFAMESWALPKPTKGFHPLESCQGLSPLTLLFGLFAGLAATAARLIALRAVRSLTGVLLRLGTLGFAQTHQRVSPFGNLPRASPLTRLFSLPRLRCLPVPPPPLIPAPVVPPAKLPPPWRIPQNA